ncbi:phage tail protein [Avibacterium sp. 20-15]|uniref:phage tail protein n=1 Tax=Avibacterium sp. 20-15 TaxID=2911523 RepID=UPI002247F0BA|nr:phage tail protein [Avibacterium sp. 20-15]MCW9731892.1 phage tail protein [Avibacterium sp. 20-15]MCW9733749.1 phage tail protein [Avibacterium sp. 20-15]
MGGGGGGGGRTPVEAPESGRSKQLVNIVEIISEGEIQGLVDGVKSVYLDKTPIQASDDSYNFNNVDAQGRIGVQDQDIMEGFNTSEKEVAVSAQVRKTVPITRTITDSKVSRLRLTLGVQSLFSQNDQGDTNGTRVELRVTIGERIYPVVIEGKYSSQYLRQFEYGDLPPVPFQVRVERLTDDSKSQRLQNNTVWSSYTEIIETQFAYPNTALVGIQFDSEYFGSIPNRNYEIYGIKLKVPSNYDPINRTYTGLWDGTFKIAWSNNPAWVLYDLMTNKRYGLGQRLGEFSVDKWTLYQVAQYCDQLVPDGFGGKEPRFTCNAWLVEQRKAYDVINDICSIFRAMPVWNGREFTVVMDRPADPVWTYTNANVVNGEFSYQYSALKARHNEIHVEYIDASDSYEKKVEVVSDDALIRRYGLNIKKVTAFGCTSRGQAHRAGKWILETERLETKTVTFSVGAEGLMHIPGDIIRVADSDYAATNIGGRVLAIEGHKAILDREITISGKSYLTYINAEGKHKDIRILGVAEGNQAVLETMPEDLVPYTVWTLTTQQINVQLFKCLSISEEEKGKYTIVALQHEPQKEAIVDNGAVFEPRETTLATSGLRKVNNVSVQANSDGIELSFDAIVQNSAMVKYQIKLYRDGKFYKLYDNLTTPKMTFVGLPDGEYIAEVRAKNAQGQLSEPVTKTFTVRLAVSELVTVPKMFAIELNWRNPIFANPKTAIEIWVSQDNQFANARKLVSLAYPTSSYTYTGLGLNDRFWFWARMVDGDNAGQFTDAVEGRPSQDATVLTDYLHGKITKSELDQSLIDSLQADIASAVENEAGNRKTAVANAISQVVAESQARAKAIQDEAKARTAALNAEVTNRTKAIQTESTKLTAKIQAEANARGTAISQLQNVDTQQAQKITALTAKAEQALSGLDAEKVARAKGDEAEARQRTALTSRVASAESGLTTLQRTVSTQAQSLSEISQNLNAKLDNLQIGGRNYADDGDFSRGRWHFSTGSRDDRNHQINDGIVTVTGSSTTWKQWQLYSKPFGSTKGSKSLGKIEVGNSYTLSFEARCISGSPQMWMRVRENRRNGLPTVERITTGYINLTDQWQRYSMTGLLQDDGENFDFWRIILGYSQIGQVQYRKVKLEKGTVATDWTPAPEDLESAVEAVSADLTSYKSTQATKEQATAQQVSNLTTRMATAESGIARVEKTVSDNRTSTAAQLNQLTANLNKANSQITEEKSARASGDKANADKITALTSRVSNAEAGITNIQSTKANKTEVASLARTTLQSEWRRDAKAEVDNIKVGGRNFLQDTETFSPEFWRFSKHQDEPRVGRVEDGVLLLPSSTALYSSWSLIAKKSTALQKVELGEQYTISFWYKATKDMSVSAYVRQFYDDNSFKDNARSSFVLPKSDEWVRVSKPIVINKLDKEGRNREALQFIFTSYATADGVIYIKKPKLEKGTIATDWTPAPEDLESAVEAVSAKVDSTRETLTRADQALGQRIDTVTASINDAKAQISTVSRAVATTDGKLSATHTIKTQTIAGGRKAIAGIALGASGDNRTAESSVIVIADKFGVVKNASDGNVVPMLSVVNNRVAVNGDLIADGTIIGKHIRANQTISAPNITGGSITGTTITGNRINGGTINGSTIEGGIIRGTRLEGATGKFTGQLEVTEIIGSNIYEFFTYVCGKLRYSTDRKQVNIYIDQRPVDRMIRFITEGFNIEKTYQEAYDGGDTYTRTHNRLEQLTINGVDVKKRNYYFLPKNTRGNIILIYADASVYYDGILKIDAFIANSARTIHL